MVPEVLGIGIQDFEKIRRTNNFYVDKTWFIKEWWEANSEAVLVTRPRRFGKTLNMSMLNCFFSNQYENRGDLFQGLSIWESEDYRKLQGTYPVIFITFAGIKPDHYESFLFYMEDFAARLYLEHEYLLQKESLNASQKEDFIKIRDHKVTNPDVIKMAVHNLSMYLRKYFGKKVIVILDEYDTPMQEAYTYGYWEEAATFMRGFFNSSFKTNPNLERVIMTGITRISKESIFSDFNHLVVCSITSNQFETAFGFTEEEVFAALDIYGLRNRARDVKVWYDGFTFGKANHIYNPWSILNYLNERELKSYWANTSSNSLLSKLIQRGSPELKQGMEQLLKEEKLEMELDEQVVFGRLAKTEEAVWGLLAAAGYLRMRKLKWTGRKNRYGLSITNLETKIMFESMVEDWFQSDGTYHGFIKALLKNDVEEMNDYMNIVAKDTFSFFDVGGWPSGKQQPERFYHGFVLGLLVELHGRYEIKSNRESGFGRYDVVLVPLDKKDAAIIMEFKVFQPKKEKSLQETVQNALTQIEQKDYDRELLAKGISKDRIYHYGFAFKGKEVVIGGAAVASAFT